MQATETITETPDLTMEEDQTIIKADPIIIGEELYFRKEPIILKKNA